MILPLLLSLVVSFALTRPIIPFLKRLKAGQSIREDGPGSHLVKAGTPTMGGIIFLGAVLITVLIFSMYSYRQTLVLLGTFGFGAVGFIDDYLKVVRKQNLGLTSKQKLALQLIMAAVLIFVGRAYGVPEQLKLPFTSILWNTGILYVPLMLFIVVGTVNSVNLTDGLDGLSTSVTIVVALFFAYAAKKLGMSDITELSMAFVGALLGFLMVNKYPAKVFMGDTGSLALGGAVSAMAMGTGLSLFLPIAGGIYFAETLSVIIQVISFQTRGKRIFLMSPLHHHYEQKGWKETKVVLHFVVAALILGVIAYVGL